MKRVLSILLVVFLVLSSVVIAGASNIDSADTGLVDITKKTSVKLTYMSSDAVIMDLDLSELGKGVYVDTAKVTSNLSAYHISYSLNKQNDSLYEIVFTPSVSSFDVFGNANVSIPFYDAGGSYVGYDITVTTDFRNETYTASCEYMQGDKVSEFSLAFEFDNQLPGALERTQIYSTLDTIGFEYEIVDNKKLSVWSNGAIEGEGYCKVERVDEYGNKNTYTLTIIVNKKPVEINKTISFGISDFIDYKTTINSGKLTGDISMVSLDVDSSLKKLGLEMYVYADDDNPGDYIVNIYAVSSLGYAKTTGTGTGKIILTSDSGESMVYYMNVNIYSGYFKGDANKDYLITVSDATTVQQHLAGISLLVYSDKWADTNDDNVTTIIDATNIQKYLAKYSVCGKVGEFVNTAVG